MSFADLADTTHRHGVGRRISQEEALEILGQSEKDGLVLMTSTTQEPEFVCACCRCCCGPVSMMRMMPRPVDFAGGNFQARANESTCNGCQKCLKRCPTGAIRFDTDRKKATEVDTQRCIG